MDNFLGGAGAVGGTSRTLIFLEENRVRNLGIPFQTLQTFSQFSGRVNHNGPSIYIVMTIFGDFGE